MTYIRTPVEFHLFLNLIIPFRHFQESLQVSLKSNNVIFCKSFIAIVMYDELYA